MIKLFLLNGEHRESYEIAFSLCSCGVCTCLGQNRSSVYSYVSQGYVCDIVVPISQPSVPTWTRALRTESTEVPVQPPDLQVTPALRNNRDPTQVTVLFTQLSLMNI